MDFRTELAKWGYNKGNSVDVEILIDEILPSLFSQQKQERSYSEEEVINFLQEMNNWPTNFEGKIDIKDWFEQYKKK